MEEASGAKIVKVELGALRIATGDKHAPSRRVTAHFSKLAQSMFQAMSAVHSAAAALLRKVGSPTVSWHLPKILKDGSARISRRVRNANAFAFAFERGVPVLPDDQPLP